MSGASGRSSIRQDVHQAEDALGGGVGPLVHVDDLPELCHRPDEPLGEQDEDDELTGREGAREEQGRAAAAGQRPQAADEERDHEPDAGEDAQPREEPNPGLDGVPVRVEVVLGDVLDAVGLVPLGVVRLDNLDAAEVVLQSRVELADRGADLGVLWAGLS